MDVTNTDKTQKHVLKIEYEGEIRKYRSIENYNGLIVAIAKTIGFGVMNCRFTYVDDDGDKITVTNNEDLMEAIKFFEPKIPKLTLVTYSEEIDASISQLKLDTGDSDDDFDLPLQFESEDRPKQGPEDWKVEYKRSPRKSEEIEQNLVNEPSEDEQKDETNLANKIDDFDEDRPRQIEIAKPEINEEEKFVEEIAQDDDIKIEATLDINSLKAKIKQLVLEQAKAIIPELIEQYKPKVNKDDTFHPISCDMCKVKSIIGFRYKCAICPNYDLCSECEAKNTHNHPFLKIKSPESYQNFLKHLCNSSD